MVVRILELLAVLDAKLRTAYVQNAVQAAILALFLLERFVIRRGSGTDLPYVTDVAVIDSQLCVISCRRLIPLLLFLN